MDEQEEQPQEQIETSTISLRTKLYIKIGIVALIIIVAGTLIFFYAPSERLECFKNNNFSGFEDIAWKIDETGKCVEYSTMPFADGTPRIKSADEIDITGDWKTYRNEEYGFEFQYPPKYTAGDLTSPARIFEQPGLISFVSVDVPGTLPGTFTLSLFSNLGTLSVSDWVEDNHPSFYRDDVAITNLTICGVQGLDYSSVQGTKRGVYFENKDTVYAIEWHGYTKVNSEQQTQYNSIVSSFKCSLSADISDWKTYRNEEYGFEFQYPSEWVIGKTPDKPVTNVSSHGFIGASLLQVCPLGDCRDFVIDPDVSTKNDFINIGEYIGSRTIYFNSEVKNEVNFVFINFNPPRKNLPDFQINFYPNDLSINNDVYLQILSTFKFTEPQSITERPLTKEGCEIEGKEWRKAGAAREFMCIETYIDGGELCNSSNECAGDCIIASYESPAFCEYDDDPFGCSVEIEDEKQVILCVD